MSRKNTVLSCAVFAGLALISHNAQALDPTPITNLPSHFNSNGISYQGPYSYSGNTSRSSDWKLFSFPDPSDNETLGVFFELQTKSALASGAHFAIMLRGPTLQDPHRGRGLAIGNLGSHPGCSPSSNSGRGAFIENFSADNTDLLKDFSDTGGYADPVAFHYNSIYQGTKAIQHTRCEPVAMDSWTTYRIDIHVSKGNTWVGIWEKDSFGGWDPFLELNCSTDDSQSGLSSTASNPVPCPEFNGQNNQTKVFSGHYWTLVTPNDSNVGNVLIGSGSGSGSYAWKAEKVYIAKW